MKKLLLIILLLVSTAASGATLLPIRVPNTSTITLSLVLSRSSCTAPCGLIGNGSSSTDSATIYPFHEVAYKWDWGDDQGVFWLFGANPNANNRNISYGGIGAHVYDIPGTYTVRLTGTNAAGSTSTTTTVTIADPNVVFSGTNTICVKQSGGADCSTFGISGANQQTTANCSTILGFVTSGKRVLLNRGQNVTCGSVVQFGAITGAQLDAYGTGAKPIVTWASGDLLSFGSNTASNVSIANISLDGGSNGSNTAIMAGGGIHPSQITVYNVDVNHFGRGAVEWDGAEWVVANVNAANFTSSIAIPFFNQQNGKGAGPWSYSALLGSSADLSPNAGFETFRSPFCRFCAITDNTLTGPTTSFAAFKFHGISTGGVYDGTPTEYVSINYNKIVEAGASVVVEVKPQNSGSDERIQNVVFERNWVIGKSASNVELWWQCQTCTIRDNIIRTANSTVGGVWLNRVSASAPTNNLNFIYNNTFYNTSSFAFIGVNIDSTATNTTVKNSLCWSPSSSSASTVINNAGASTTASNNSTNTQCRSGGSNPGFTAVPVNPIDFKPTNAPATNGGTSPAIAGALKDFFQNPFASPAPLGAVAP